MVCHENIMVIPWFFLMQRDVMGIPALCFLPCPLNIKNPKRLYHGKKVGDQAKYVFNPIVI